MAATCMCVLVMSTSENTPVPDDTDRNVIVGATTVGPHGGEMIAFLALAVHAKIPVAILRQMIYAYPTFWRGIEDTLNQFGSPAGR